METVDCSRVDLTFMGHSYFGSNTDVLGDLFMWSLRKTAPPVNDLTWTRKQGKKTYWQFARTAPTILYTWHFEAEATNSLTDRLVTKAVDRTSHWSQEQSPPPPWSSG